MQKTAWSTRKAFRLVIEWKESRPCVGCGFYFPYFQIEADHVPERGQKKFNLGAREARNYSERELIEELAKCDALCRNCHAARGWLRLRGLGLSDLKAHSTARLSPGACIAAWTKTRRMALEKRLDGGRAYFPRQASSGNTCIPPSPQSFRKSSNQSQTVRRRLF